MTAAEHSELGMPEMFRIRQRFQRERVMDVAAETRQQLEKLRLDDRVRAGESVAITAGSRGIANIHLIIKEVVEHFRRLGARPFVVPAMGSHGGGTASGQQKILAGYGITEEFLGCPIRATMETVIVCHTPQGLPVHFDRHAYEADHVCVVGRIKPHTNFTGEIESGLMKMMLIGLGKHAGAKIYHRAIMDHSFAEILSAVAQQVLTRCRIVAGVAIVENGYDETARIEAVLPQDFESRERELLKLAKQWMPRIPFEEADLLIIDQIGKNISGAGLDTNIVGRKHNDHAATGAETPRIRRIMIRDLTPETGGNAAGIGIAEFCSRGLLDKIDLHVTRINCLTGGHPTAAMIPLHYDSEAETIRAALSTVGLRTPETVRVLWIRDTLHLEELECSRAYLQTAELLPNVEILTQPRAIPQDNQGNLPWLNELRDL